MPSEFRCCEMCGETKELEKFANAGQRGDVKYYRYKCIPCYAQFKYARKRKQHQQFIEYRKTLKCERCGFDDWRVIEFHHRDPSEKEKDVSNMMSWAWEKIEKEIQKCDALCANCHRIIHYELREAKRSGISSV